MIWLLLGGLLGGFIGGLLGIGGAPIYLVVYWHIMPILYPSIDDVTATQLVIANAVLVRTFAALSGCYSHYRNDNLYLDTVIAISIPATLVSLALIILLSHVHYTKTIFSICFILFFLPLLYQMFRADFSKKNFNQPNRIKVFYLNGIGVVCGLVTALTGLGAGFVVVPMLNNFFNIKLRKVASISLSVILLSSVFIVFYYLIFYRISVDLPYTIGALSLPLAIPVIIAGLISSPLGVAFARRLAPSQLRHTFIVFCILIIGHEIWQLLRHII